MIKKMFRFFSNKARAKRKKIFLKYMAPTDEHKILDLGSEEGSYFASIVPFRKNVYIADIDANILKKGKAKYGFNTVLIPEDGRLPFPDNFFDIVHCSSCIEHVTVDKKDLEGAVESRTFREKSKARQKIFADEIKRVGRNYYVQTPNKFFIIESHTWLPFIGYLGSRWQSKLIKIFNIFWIKKTSGDFNLLTGMEMKELFPKANIIFEYFLFMRKSIIAVKKVDV